MQTVTQPADWQTEYIQDLKNNKQDLEATIQELKDIIKKADKRAYNGRMTKIFEGARILAIQHEIDFQNSKRFYQK